MFSTWQGILGFFGVGCATSFLVFVWLQGRRSRGGNKEENALHRVWVKFFYGALVVGVVGIELLVQKHGGLWDTSWLAWLHGIFVVACIVLLSLLPSCFTGLKHPKTHAPLAYTLIVVYCGMLTTGSVLLSRFPG